MAKNRYVTFGDIILDKSTGINYVAVNAGQSLKKQKAFILFVELTDKLECILKPPIPFDRPTIRDFKFVKNTEESIKQYLNGLKINFDPKSVVTQGFTVSYS